MKFKFIGLFSLVFILNSCKNENEKRLVENKKDAQKKELIFSKIDKGWNFNAIPLNETSEAYTTTWPAWRDFMTELSYRPQKTIGAFQKRATALSKKVTALNTSIPTDFDKPQIKARISVLMTKVRMLDLYIHLKDIPSEKVLALIPEINMELMSLQNQMDKIVQKSKIPLEEGESDLIKMLDSARAIPNSPQMPIDPNIPRFE